MVTVGVLTPHAAPGAEIELPIMAPGAVRVEVSRTRGDSSAAALDEAAALLPTVDVLAFASTGSGYVLGHGREAALVKRLYERWKVPVCAASRSAVSALRSRHIERISLVHPPWFGSSLNELGTAYFRSQGFEVVDAHLADLPGEPGHIAPAMVVEWVAQHLSDRAEAVFLGGNGFPAARAIHELELRTGRLVLEANQVLLWSVLKNDRAAVAVRGFGELFDGRPFPADREKR